MITYPTIDSAPRDGTEILAFNEAGNWHQVYWKSPEACSKGDLACWRMRWNPEYRQYDYNFTHWTHLPEKP
jgi:hypothetical protein